MKLYEVNEEILRLTDQIKMDEETGEVSGDVDAICSQINALQLERHSILQFLAKLVLNLRADITALPRGLLSGHWKKCGRWRKKSIQKLTSLLT